MLYNIRVFYPDGEEVVYQKVSDLKLFEKCAKFTAREIGNAEVITSLPFLAEQVEVEE